MDNLLTRELEASAPLSVEDRRLLDDIVKPSRIVEARTDIMREDHVSKDVRIVLEGFACRYKFLKNGTRQIVAYLIPGGFRDLNVFILKAMDHSVDTLSRWPRSATRWDCRSCTSTAPSSNYVTGG